MYPVDVWPVELRSGEILLRPIRRRDKKAWHRLRERNRDWLRRWDATSPAGVSGPRSFNEMVHTYRKQARDGQTLPFMVVVDGTLVGQVTVNNIVRGSGQFASVGYWIDQSHAGRGITTRAVAMVVDHCFYAARLHRVEVAIRPENEASLRVVEKLGLREYGYAKRYLHIDGDWRDHRLFEVTIEQAPGGLVRRLQQSRPQ